LTPLDILATGTTWDVFLIFLRHKIVWMTPDVYLCHTHRPGAGIPLFFIKATGGTLTLRVFVTPGTAVAVATATCNFLVRLFGTYEHHALCIQGGGNLVPARLSGACLYLYFEESRDDLRKVYLSKMVLSKDLCLALTTMSPLDVELGMNCCRLSNNAVGAFVECLQSDRGPVNLVMSEIDSQIIASALTGNSRVTLFKPADGWTDDAEKAVLFRAVANNRGLVDLDLCGHSISDENWTSLCQSLKAHPTLTSLGLDATTPRRPVGVTIDEQMTRRTRAWEEMMQQNTVLHTIELAAFERDDQVYTKEIRPYLVTYLYIPRVHAVKKTKDRSFREKVLGRAVYSARSNPNLVWMILSENVDAFVLSEEESNSEVPTAVTAAVVVLTVAGKR
jgi:hypothetical protein